MDRAVSDKHVDGSVLASAKALFSAYSLDDDGTVAEIATTAKHNNMTIDPHSAVGVHAARCAHADGTVAQDVPIVALACAHPAKFNEAVTKAIGVTPSLPPHLLDLMQRPERLEHVAPSTEAVKSLIIKKKRSI